MNEDIETLMQRIESLRQERDAAEKACAAVRQYSHKVSAIGYKEGVVGSHVLMLLEEHGKGWHSPEEWDAAERAITEMRQRIANCHDRLLRGDTDPELLKLLEGNWGPATGKGYYSREQVRPLVEVIVNVLDNFTPDHLNHITGSLLGTRLQQALAHARVVGMEKL